MNHYILIAKLIQACGKIEGRVKFQKIVYILQDMGHPFREEFGYLHHGPYSSDLKSEIDQLCEWELVNEVEQPVKDYMRYEYSPNKELRAMLSEIGDESVPEWSELARQLNRMNATDLEGISTIMFLRRRDFDGERLETRYKELKPHLADDYKKCRAEAERLTKLSCVSAL
jgi:uncharacterized protein YwgA